MNNNSNLEKHSTINSLDFYQGHLDRVSRSFSFCIKKLEGPMRHWVSLTYLVCRILDTVEDAPWKKASEQIKKYHEFNQFLKSTENLEEASEWLKHFPGAIPKGEKSLLKDSRKVFQELHHAPAAVRKVIQDLVGSMSAGMQHFSNKKKNGELRLANVSEVNQYCFFVAGLVGEALSKLLVAVDTEIKTKNELLVNAHHFGLFLQKVNLLKDQVSDEKEGRFLIPSRPEVFMSLGENALGAKLYLDSIPLEHRGYRLFCAWSLYLGLASLPWIEEAYNTKKTMKISRGETKALVHRIETMIDDPKKLDAYFNEKFQLARLKSNMRVSSGETNQLEFKKFYHGELEDKDFKALGLIT